MGVPQFPFVRDIDGIIGMLNKSALDLWNLSVVHQAESLYVYDGDQAIFVASTVQEVLDFLAGAFVATFNGKGLDQIKSELSSGSRQPDD